MENLPRVGLGLRHEVFRSAFGDNPAASIASFGAQVYDMVS